MSGRAYARTAQGFLGGGAHLESVVPHSFRIALPKRSDSARELGIRRVIRRQCMEKNWKKIIARRHARAETDERPPQPPGGESPVKSASGGGDAAKQPERKPKQEKKPDSETVGIAKRQLEELEAKLQLLVDEKHAKFLQLKTILVQEARSKSSSSSNSSSTPAPASVALGSAGQASKKRRVDAKDVAVGSATSPHSALNELSAADSPRTAAAEPASSSLS